MTEFNPLRARKGRGGRSRTADDDDNSSKSLIERSRGPFLEDPATRGRRNREQAEYSKEPADAFRAAPNRSLRT
jgi:hypothetical protein